MDGVSFKIVEKLGSKLSLRTEIFVFALPAVLFTVSVSRAEGALRHLSRFTAKLMLATMDGVIMVCERHKNSMTEKEMRTTRQF
ncbi:hypothetical protein K469DRAFT_710755 [Zopfia rhizophila CBS 207.26]|uniref:Uncharacterized protein n=1 Tax=Zopfia rhizophila CBS 207.26 TaxID=1314779 RepID=A0A6A6DZC7_9PEZI|nr:hypothetical protein K469DRAFT_710755 [Zopfia rhizophila CBS 207.26]